MLTSLLSRRDVSGALAAGLAALPLPARAGQRYDVRDFGARGDGVTLDTDAVNRAIAAASRGGGGTVVFPAGRYLCFSIRLQSRVTLQLDAGAVIEGADPAVHPGRYDDPEQGSDGLYQDFGHSHWRNSLIWGDGVEDIAILGPGMIHGKGLTRNGPGARWTRGAGERPNSMAGMSATEISRLEPAFEAMRGLGNKAIALKNARNVRLSGFTLLLGGHFAILATGVEGLTIDRLTIDTQRDGIDLDCVRNATVTNCRVNTPNDDAIVLKSSFALGRAVPTEHVLVRDCTVSGYDVGTMIDGTRGRTTLLAPDRDGPTGRIKLGTESNGGYRHILIERCRFERSRGLALETVDGGAMEDVIARDLTMREVTTAPIFVRLGDRRRGPAGTRVGSTRGIVIADIDAAMSEHRYPAIVAGLPGHPVRDVALRNIHLAFPGGGTAAEAATRPEDQAEAYPEPSMFGPLPAWGLWMRHAEGITIDRLSMETAVPDARPAIVTQDAARLTVTRTPLWPGAVHLDPA
ncbi:glycoside hydrolase family 28 protein [Sphingomonas cannabina]|uniref:rhamnogalacturonidase n=1 Tax=Sphingomonas cannabina TaxID=2899123 RepID=UPI001F45C0E6|nr:glycosyl hydrolase family 28-related protein [Sphingomonas cannabina]UIJ43979.1 glycoside hydrolase family 28 protein [Sphingomonas cannabina]